MGTEPTLQPSNTPRPNGWPRFPALMGVLSQISRKHWLYLPRLFSRQEKIYLAALAAAAALALTGLTTRIIGRVTIERPAVGGLLREGTLREPRFVNPIYASNDAERDIAGIIFSGLVRYDAAGRAAMDLAEDIETSPDGKAYTVRLKRGVRWHDGESFSADDVVFTIKTIQDPEYKSPLRANWQGVSAEKLNDFAVRFTLRQPYAPFLENLAVGILPEHLWRKIPRETAILSDLNLKPIGTGPYQFKKLIRREDGSIVSLLLARSRTYHRGGPYLNEVRFSFYPSAEQITAAYRRNEIDAFAFSSADHLAELQRLDLEIHELNIPKIFAIFLNPSSKSWLGRPKVRRALSLAVNRSALIDKTSAGAGVVANSAIPPGTAGHNPSIAAIPFEPEEARRILADEGWKDVDGDGILERTDRRKTEKLELVIITSDAPELAEAARLIAEMWREIGVRAETKIFSLTDLEASVIRPRAYEVLLFGEVFGHDPDPFAFWHSSQIKDPGLNIALFSNRAADQLLEEARRTSEPKRRETKYQEFQKIVSDEIGAIFLYRPTSYYAIRRGTRGVEIGSATLPEERFNAINTWYQDTRRALR